MKIPDEAARRYPLHATPSVDEERHKAGYHAFIAGAEWARKEALREAEQQVRDYWDACGELIDSNNGARLAFEAVAEQIAEGVHEDSSNAEKRETVVERAWREHPDEMARAHTEFRVAELTRLLAESRARFGDSEARRAELEAVIDHVRRWNVGKEFLTRHPSVVLEDRDRENRAIGWDAAVGALVHEDGTPVEVAANINPYRGDNA